jgi:hypothetical protein
VVNSGKRQKPGHAAVGIRIRLLTILLGLWTLAGGGCGIWDDFRSEDYSFRRYFYPDDPIVVLKTSTDVSKKARALGRLREPLENKGTKEDQDFVVGVLTDAATNWSEAYARLEAIKTLRTFKDPRAFKALEAAYEKGEAFPPETRSVIRIQAMDALGKSGNPAAVDLLVTAMLVPPLDPAKSTEQEKQTYLEERLVAARSLQNFKNYRATEALVRVLKTERDVAMIDCVTHSLQVATGKKLPPDAKAWEDLLNNPAEARDRSLAQDPKARLDSPIQRTSGTDKVPPRQ